MISIAKHFLYSLASFVPILLSQGIAHGSDGVAWKKRVLVAKLFGEFNLILQGSGVGLGFLKNLDSHCIICGEDHEVLHAFFIRLKNYTGGNVPVITQLAQTAAIFPDHYILALACG